MVNAEERTGSCPKTGVAEKAALALGKSQRKVISLILKVYSTGDFCKGLFFFFAP